MTSNLGEKGKDSTSWDQYFLTPEQREGEADRFKDPNDPTKILIVVDMLLVGYDVPIVQVMYLDNLVFVLILYLSSNEVLILYLSSMMIG